MQQQCTGQFTVTGRPSGAVLVGVAQVDSGAHTPVAGRLEAGYEVVSSSEVRREKGPGISGSCKAAN